MPQGQKRKKDNPGEPRKNGTGGSFATFVPDAAEDVDLVAARDGWTASDWERYHDERHEAGESGDSCSECGGGAYPGLDELCRQCALRTGDYTEDDLPEVAADASDAPSRGYELLRQAWLPKGRLPDDYSHQELYVADAAATLDFDPTGPGKAEGQTNSDWAKFTLPEPHPLGGYDTVNVQGEAGKRVFYHWGPYFDRAYGVTANELHRLDGPAEVHEDRDDVAWIEGKRLTCSDAEGGYRFKSAEPNGDGYDKLWVAEDGSGLLEFADGGIAYIDTTHAYHRVGAPAAIDADGNERWFLHGQEWPDPRPAPVVEKPILGDHGQPIADTCGGKFDANVPLEQVSMRVLADLQNAADLGYLPVSSGPKVSVNPAERTITLRLSAPVLDNLEARERWRERAYAIALQYNAWSRGDARPSRFVTTVEVI